MSKALERRKKIVELRFEGLLRDEIALRLGCSRAAVMRVARTFLEWPEDEKFLAKIRKNQSSGHGPPQ